MITDRLNVPVAAVDPLSEIQLVIPNVQAGGKVLLDIANAGERIVIVEAAVVRATSVCGRRVA